MGLSLAKKYNSESFKFWLEAARAPFFTATIIPVLLGTAAAGHDTGIFMPFKFLLVLAGIVFIHAGTNLSNDYFDHTSGCDQANPNPTPFSGGSRVIQDGLVSARKILLVAISLIFAGSLIGLYLNYSSRGNVILIMGLAGVLLAFFYTAGPVRIGYSSFGEIVVGICFGPFVVVGSYYVQAGSLPLNIFLISIPVGILVALILFINEFPDYEGDKAVGKKTLVVILGKKKAAILYNVLLAVTYLLIAGFVFAGVLPAFCLIALLSLPLAIKAFTVARKDYDKIEELFPANGATIGIHSAIGLLITAGILLDRFF